MLSAISSLGRNIRLHPKLLWDSHAFHQRSIFGTSPGLLLVAPPHIYVFTSYLTGQDRLLSGPTHHLDITCSAALSRFDHRQNIST